MYIAGAILITLLAVGSFTLAQIFFFRHTRRAFWRALVPTSIRYMILPDDTVHMDSFMVMEEYATIMFCGAFLLLPLIALNVAGLISLF